MICFSGITDCYQPAERNYGLTRSCLQVAAEARQPIGIITKNRLVTRDLDVLAPMAEALAGSRVDQHHHPRRAIGPADGAAHEPTDRAARGDSRAVAGRRAHAGDGGPRDSRPERQRDSANPQSGSGSGSRHRGPRALTTLWLRAPGLPRLAGAERTDAPARVEGAIRQTRGGQLNDTQFGRRMRGTGTRAEQIHQTFATFAKRYGLGGSLSPFDFSQFRPPLIAGGQLRLF